MADADGLAVWLKPIAIDLALSEQKVQHPQVLDLLNAL